MIVEQLVPALGAVDLDSVLARMADRSGAAAPFAEGTLAFFSEVSRQLGSSPSTAAMPEVRALAFWMRRAQLIRLREQFEELQRPGTLRLPRGTVFHLAPANVDTIFVYSWLLASLAGNRSVIRLPSLRGPATQVICETLNAVLASREHCGLATGVAIVGYAHDEATTAAISARSDVRVIWGGDATVQRIRQIPLPPRSVELTFADRYSLAAIDARAYLHATPRRRAQLAEDFVGDLFSFGQMACSSPQMLAWRGSRADVEAASDDFFPRVAATASRRGYEVDAGTATAQTLAAATLAADQPVRRCRRFGRQLLVAELESASETARSHVGGGYLLSVRLGEIADLIPFLTSADQTLAHFGFEEDELRRFAVLAAGTGGIDRIVPIGQALTFDRFWDGYDLLASFTRIVRVAAPPTGGESG